ncbi:MAG: SulP family inorganic anion transporter [Tenacibaculum sp.]|nr:SulP family inorganic anion transporter [Tenacibaculum sp.]
MKNLFSNLKGDLFGGVTAGIVALPLALAFGVSSGLGPSAGLYGAIFLAFFAALFGGTSTQISGPTAPMTAVSMVAIASLVASNDGDLSKALPIILAVFLFAGLFQILLGLIGIGKYVKYIPYPVVSGFMTAIGVIILITQIPPMVGYYASEDTAFVETFKPQAKEVVLKKILENETNKEALRVEHFGNAFEKGKKITENDILAESKKIATKKASGTVGALKVLPNALKNISWLEFLLTIGTIIIIYGFKRITTVIPSTLVALVVMTGIALIFNLNYRTIEEIPAGFPVPNLEIFTSFSFSSIAPYFITSITLAFLGAIDSLLTSVVADNMTNTKHKPNKELIGQGIGNSVAAIFGGIPGAGATIRTVVNINAGGRTKLSGMMSGITLLIFLLGLGPIASKIPAAVLAGILITVGFSVLDYKGLKDAPRLLKDIKVGPLKLSSDVLIMAIVLVLSTFWNLLFAVGLGLIIASLIFMMNKGDLTKETSETKPLQDDVYVSNINGSLFFGSSSDFQEKISEIPENASTVIFTLDRMRHIDQSGLYVLQDTLTDLKNKNKQLLFVNALELPKRKMELIGIIPNLVSNERIFNSLEEATNWINKKN